MTASPLIQLPLTILQAFQMYGHARSAFVAGEKVLLDNASSTIGNSIVLAEIVAINGKVINLNYVEEYVYGGVVQPLGGEVTVQAGYLALAITDRVDMNNAFFAKIKEQLEKPAD